MNEADSRIMAMTGMKWFRNSYGVIVNGIGWEIDRDPGLDAHDEGPWALYHHGEYVGNYSTVEDAKADVDTSDCSKCRTLEG